MNDLEEHRYAAIAFTYSTGHVQRVVLQDNEAETSRLLLGSLAPLWLRQRVSWLRSSDTDDNASGRASGVRFELGTCYLCLNGTEYRDLLDVIESCR